ncbi:hypothetical protein RYX36_011128 [Vicia faba]
MKASEKLLPFRCSGEDESSGELQFVSVQAETEFVASIAAVAFVVVTVVLEMVKNLMHLIIIGAKLEPSIDVAREQSVGLSTCLHWQIEVQGLAAAVTQ